MCKRMVLVAHLVCWVVCLLIPGHDTLGMLELLLYSASPMMYDVNNSPLYDLSSLATPFLRRIEIAVVATCSYVLARGTEPRAVALAGVTPTLRAG